MTRRSRFQNERTERETKWNSRSPDRLLMRIRNFDPKNIQVLFRTVPSFLPVCWNNFLFGKKYVFLHSRKKTLLKKKIQKHRRQREGTWAIPLNSSRTSFPHLIRWVSRAPLGWFWKNGNPRAPVEGKLWSCIKIEKLGVKCISVRWY